MSRRLVIAHTIAFGLGLAAGVFAPISPWYPHPFVGAPMDAVGVPAELLARPADAFTIPFTDLKGTPSTPDERRIEAGATAVKVSGKRPEAGSIWESRRHRASVFLPRPELHTLAISIGGEHGLDVPIFLALIGDESSWKVRAVGKHGERGLLQLKASTAAWCGIRDRFDAAANLRCGARYLLAQFERFGSWELAVVAFKAGPESIPERIPASSWEYAQRALLKAEAYR